MAAKELDRQGEAKRSRETEQHLEKLFFICLPGVSALSHEWIARAAGVKLGGKISRKDTCYKRNGSNFAQKPD